MGVKTTEYKKATSPSATSSGSGGTRPVATSRLFNQGKDTTKGNSAQPTDTKQKSPEASSKKQVSVKLAGSNSSAAAPQGVIITTRQQSNLFATGSAIP